jgi:hypothetical protein
MKEGRNQNPYIFLDIDGVLATNQELKIHKSKWYNNNTYPFNKNCVNTLNKILVKTNAEIILSSTWRRVFELDELEKIFKFNNINKSPIDKTPVLGDRDSEIREFITSKKLSKFVIIDDSQLTGYRERFIKTNPDKGLQNEHYKKIIKLLKED